MSNEQCCFGISSFSLLAISVNCIMGPSRGCKSQICHLGLGPRLSLSLSLFLLPLVRMVFLSIFDSASTSISAITLDRWLSRQSQSLRSFFLPPDQPSFQVGGLTLPEFLCKSSVGSRRLVCSGVVEMRCGIVQKIQKLDTKENTSFHLPRSTSGFYTFLFGRRETF